MNLILQQKCNEILRTCYADLLDVTSTKSLGKLQSLRQYNGEAAACVVATRFGKGLYTNEKGNVEELKFRAAADYIRSEHRLHSFNTPNLFKYGSMPAEQLTVLYKARSLLRQWFRQYDSWGSSIKIPPGETYIPGYGIVNLHAKLSNEWSVTEDAYDAFVMLIMNTRYLRRMMRVKLYQKYGDQLEKVVKELRVLCRTRFSLYRSLYRPLIRVVEGSRFASVPKDTGKRRPINIEPLGNILLQYLIGGELRRVNLSVGNDLNLGQQHHQQLCKDLRNATIDFSGASDTISLALISFLFQNNGRALASLHEDILMARSPMVLVDFGDQANPFTTNSDPWVYLNKVSSMGNGFTFELLTTVLLAIARVLDSSARVYGDDVIIRKDVADIFMRTCEGVGFIVNREKSFWKYSFRESCGTFFQEGYGEILSFEFDAIVNDSKLFTALNKLLYLTEFYKSRPGIKAKLISSICSRTRNWILNNVDQKFCKFFGPYLALKRELSENGKYTVSVPDSYIMMEPDAETQTSIVVRREGLHQTVSCRLKQLGLRVKGCRYYLRLVEKKAVYDKPAGPISDVAMIAASIYGSRVPILEKRVADAEKRFRTELWVTTTDGLDAPVMQLTTGVYSEIRA